MLKGLFFFTLCKRLNLFINSFNNHCKDFFAGNVYF